MARKLYTEDFRIDAVKQVTENGYSVTDTAERLGVHPDSLRNWIRRLESPQAIEKHKISDSANAEIKKLQKELRRARYIKKGRSVLCKQPKLKYAFIKEHEIQYTIRRMCAVLKVHPSGYYKWLKQPISNLELTNQLILAEIQKSHQESNSVRYTYK